MKISIFTILSLLNSFLWIRHLWTRPDLLNMSEHSITLWYQQLWVYQFMYIIFVIADIFYFLIKDMK